MIFVGLSGPLLLIYVPIAVYMRPKWQEYQCELHVLISPLFMVVKSNFQMLLIALTKTVERFSSTANIFVYLALMIAFTVYVIILPPFNYGRFNLWQTLFLFANIWLALMASIT
jgi:hypothetical protein